MQNCVIIGTDGSSLSKSAREMVGAERGFLCVGTTKYRYHRHACRRVARFLAKGGGGKRSMQAGHKWVNLSKSTSTIDVYPGVSSSFCPGGGGKRAKQVNHQWVNLRKKWLGRAERGELCDRTTMYECRISSSKNTYPWVVCLYG